MISTLFSILAVILALLWFSDELLTRLDIKRLGLKSEENPIIRKLEKKGEKYVFAFKVASLLIVISVSYIVFLFNQTVSYWLMGGLGLLYFMVALHNLEIYEEN